jgi:hypothetical protein
VEEGARDVSQVTREHTQGLVVVSRPQTAEEDQAKPQKDQWLFSCDPSGKQNQSDFFSRHKLSLD